MSQLSFENDCHDFGISPAALKVAAPAGASAPAAATATVRGAVLLSAASVNSAAAVPAAAPAGGVGAAAGGWDTAANRDLAIVTINGLRTLVTELQTQHNDLLTKLRAAGVLTP